MSTPTSDIKLNLAAQNAAAQLDMFSRRWKMMTRDMQASTQRLNREADKSGFAKWPGQLAKAFAVMMSMQMGMGAIRNIVDLIRQDLENSVEIAKRAQERQVPYQARLYGMTMDMPRNQADSTIKFLDDAIRGSTFKDKNMLAMVIERAVSSVSGMPYEERVRTAIEVAEARPDLAYQPEALSALATQAVVGQHVFGEQGSTPLAQLGLMQMGKTSAAVGDTQLFAKNIAALTPKAKMFGFNQFEAMTLAAAYSSAGLDIEGNISHTNLLNLMGQQVEVAKAKGVDLQSMSFEQRRRFFRGDSTDAKEIRQYMTGVLNAEFDSIFSQDDLDAMSEAQRRKVLIPHTRGRARAKMISMQAFQPQGMADDQGSLNRYIEDTFKELPIVWKDNDRSTGIIDTARSYALAERIVRKRQKMARESGRFDTFLINELVQGAKEVAALEGNPYHAMLTDPESDFNILMRDLGERPTAQKFRRAMYWFTGPLDDKYGPGSSEAMLRANVAQRQMEIMNKYGADIEKENIRQFADMDRQKLMSEAGRLNVSSSEMRILSMLEFLDQQLLRSQESTKRDAMPVRVVNPEPQPAQAPEARNLGR